MAIARTPIYEKITEQLIQMISEGVGDWEMPWHHQGSSIFRPTAAGTNRRYRGLNVLVLGAAAKTKNYRFGIWATYKQWQTLGAQVKKGETATPVIYWKQISSPNYSNDSVDQIDGDSDQNSRSKMYAREFRVFNIDQVDNYDLPETPKNPDLPIEAAQKFFDKLNINLKHGGSSAYYSPASDTIHMPDFNTFKTASAYYATLLHEAAHATGAIHRLDRKGGVKFGDALYAMEEVCAELISSFVCADLCLPYSLRDDHAPYISSWLKVLNDDPKAILQAASKAQAAADWMHSQQLQSSAIAA